MFGSFSIKKKKQKTADREYKQVARLLYVQSLFSRSLEIERAHKIITIRTMAFFYVFHV